MKYEPENTAFEPDFNAPRFAPSKTALLAHTPWNSDSRRSAPTKFVKSSIALVKLFVTP